MYVLTDLNLFFIIKAMNEYKIYDQSSIHFNGTCHYFHRLGGFLHVHRQVEILFSVQGDVTALLGDRRVELHTDDFIIIKPFELHAFSAGMKVTNKFVAPILPDDVSERVALRLPETLICHDDGNRWGEVFSLYRAFAQLSPKNRALYFQMVEDIVNAAIDGTLPSEPDTLGDTIIRYITENAERPLTLDSVAAACCTPWNTVSRTVNQRCNSNFNAFLNRVRINRFLRACMAQAPANMESAALQAGFRSARTFYRAFYAEFHMTPGQYLEKAGDGGASAPPAE